MFRLPCLLSYALLAALYYSSSAYAISYATITSNLGSAFPAIHVTVDHTSYNEAIISSGLYECATFVTGIDQVLGTGTQWLNNIQAGDLITHDGRVWYEVDEVIDNGSIRLTSTIEQGALICGPYNTIIHALLPSYRISK